MKKKSTRGKGGRKKFSAGNALSPSKSLDENLALAATGEFALTQEQRDIFRFVALWKNRYASLFKDNPSESEGAARIRRKQRERVIDSLLKVVSPALENLNPKPFETFVKAIALVKDFNDSGVLLPDAYEMLRVAEEMELTLGAKVVQQIKPKDFKNRLRRKIGDKQFARIKKSIGLHWPTGRPSKV